MAMMVGPGDEEGRVGLTAGIEELKHAQDGLSMMHFEVREIHNAAAHSLSFVLGFCPSFH